MRLRRPVTAEARRDSVRNITFLLLVAVVVALVVGVIVVFALFLERFGG